MSDTDNEKPKLGMRQPLGLKRTVESGKVKQSFSHGRSNTVVVEVKRRRVLGPGGAPVEAAVVEDAAPVVAAPPAPPAPPPRPAPAPVSPGNSLLSRQELQAKLQMKMEELNLRRELSSMTNQVRTEQQQTQAAARIATTAMQTARTPQPQ